MDFKLLILSKQLSFDIFSFSKNFPKNGVIIKNSLQECLFKSIECLHYYIVNASHVKIREKYLKDFIVNLSMIDFYLESAYKEKMLSFQKYNSFVKQIIIIRKMGYGLLKSEEV